MSTGRIKVPIRGGYFVLTPKTARYVLLRPDGTHAAEMLVNASGNGAVVLVPPGVKFAPGVIAEPFDPVAAVEALRRDNIRRLELGLAEHRIPAALIRRARAMELPGLEALVPFPGRPAKFYEGRGSWVGTGLWASADGEFQLEMRGTVGVLRKRLTDAEARAWLDVNGHQAYTVPHRDKAGTVEPDQWRIATKGHPGAGARSWFSLAVGLPDPEQEPPPDTKRSQKLRESLKSTRAIAPPQIPPPRKRSVRRRKR